MHSNTGWEPSSDIARKKSALNVDCHRTPRPGFVMVELRPNRACCGNSGSVLASCFSVCTPVQRLIWSQAHIKQFGLKYVRAVDARTRFFLCWLFQISSSLSLLCVKRAG